MMRKFLLIGALIFIVGLVAIFATNFPGQATGHVAVFTSFSREDGELPEGVAVDKVGNIYASLGPPFFVGVGYGAVWQISPDGEETSVMVEYPGGPAPAGLAVDSPGNVYFALPNPGDPVAGVYRIDADGSVERLPGSENIILPNGLALDKHGNLFASDSILGAIWRMPSDGSAPAEVWLSHVLISGCPDDFGANGIAIWKSNLYVANTSKGILVRVPILPDGSPGTPEIVAGNPDCAAEGLFGMDGIALDVHGDVYALLVLQNKLVKIDPTDGSYKTLLTDEDGLWNPASIYFGTGKGERESVFIANYAVIEEPANNLGAAVLKYDVGVPGLPLP